MARKTKSGLRGVCLAGLAALALTGAACGDEESNPTTSPTTTTTGATGLTGPTGATSGPSSGARGPGQGAESSGVASVDSASGLVDCLEGEGLEASEAGTVLGLEDYEVVQVAIGDLDGGVAIVIFDSPEEAEDDPETTGTLAGVAYPEARGNVVFGFDGAAEETPADEAAVDACLPAASGGN